MAAQAQEPVGEKHRLDSTPGSTERVERCFAEHHRDVFKYALRRTGDEAVAEEVVADTFAVVWRRAQQLPSQPLPWLYGIARRVLWNLRRSERRRIRLRASLRFEAGREGSGGSVPEGVVLESDAVARALMRLGEADREALMLVAWEALDSAAAAQALGITAGAFRVRLLRARRRFQTELEASEEGEA